MSTAPITEASASDDDIWSGLKIIDTDTHISEPHDLWTSRAPSRYRDDVPHFVEKDGTSSWILNDVVIGGATASAVVGSNGEKELGTGFFRMGIDDVHAACYETKARVQMMDTLGIHAQIVYPNLAGFGGQNFMKASDEQLRLVCVQIYNDAMAEMQAESGERLFPMAVMPWWNAEQMAAEARRCAAMGLRGVVTCSNPHDAGTPDLSDAIWNPFWETCCELSLSINFHIGSSESVMGWFGRTPWPSFDQEQKLSIASSNLFLGNAQVIGNLIYGGVPERFPQAKFVSVESGIGWIPFFLEALDHQMGETAPSLAAKLSLTPTEYFHRQFLACFWFERVAIDRLLDIIGVNNVMFETDFPHPTCLYPKSNERVRATMAGLDHATRKRIVQDNAAELYRIPV